MSSRPPLRRTRSRSVLPQGRSLDIRCAVLQKGIARLQLIAARNGEQFLASVPSEHHAVFRHDAGKLRAGGKLLRLHIERLPRPSASASGFRKGGVPPLPQTALVLVPARAPQAQVLPAAKPFLPPPPARVPPPAQVLPARFFGSRRAKMRRKAPVPVSLPIFSCTRLLPRLFLHCQLLRGIQIRLLVVSQLPAADFQTFHKARAPASFRAAAPAPDGNTAPRFHTARA